MSIWSNFSADMILPDGTTVDVSPCTDFHPERKDFMEVVIRIPAGVLPRDARQGAATARILRDVADMLASFEARV